VDVQDGEHGAGQHLPPCEPSRAYDERDEIIVAGRRANADGHKSRRRAG
jgi:hypothetical protein